MAFKASTVIPQTAYQQTKAAAMQLKFNLQAHIAQLATQNATYEFLRDIYRTLTRAHGQLTTLSTTPGLADYAVIQESDTNYDVVAEFVAMLAAIEAARQWMVANVPLAVTVKPVADWADSDIIATTFTPAQTAGFRTVLDGVVSVIS